ncbi:hypothetical protein NFI96_017985 [Prochilodus magdalenae]|nr:hypothetical protein NFI96_017985 [Prochilodus magdalenae]
MDITRLLFVALLVILPVSANRQTYEHELPSGVTVTCDRCPPGTRLHSHCTETRRTVCKPCISGFYTQFWNYIPECIPCDLCGFNQEETQKCTPSQNRQCQCKEGYYWSSHFCKKHKVCPAGQGIKTRGTPFRDTECEECASGYYAAANMQCVPHTACLADKRLVIHGTNWHDNICLSCNDITTQGWPTFAKPLLTGLFAQQKQDRLKRFVRSLSSQQTVSVAQWLSNATEQQLTDLPDLLEKANRKSLARNVERKIQKFQEEVKFCDPNINFVSTHSTTEFLPIA